MQKLNKIIADYKARKEQVANNPNNRENLWVEYCKKTTLEKVIEKAGLAMVGDTGMMFYHQRCLAKENLKKFQRELLLKTKDIEAVKNFEELLNLVEDCKVSGISDLTCYDTALRIGVKLNFSPAKIYLHSGTWKGAKKLLPQLKRKQFIEKKDLPYPFHDDELSAGDIEVILCVYKDAFNNDKEINPISCTTRKNCNNKGGSTCFKPFNLLAVFLFVICCFFTMNSTNAQTTTYYSDSICQGGSYTDANFTNLTQMVRTIIILLYLIARTAIVLFV